MKSIEVSDITKTYNGRTVVDRLSFSVDKGEVFGLLGHNGAGKSTTIDCLLGLTKPDSGSARILGQNAAKHRKRCLSMSVSSCSMRHTQTIFAFVRYVRKPWHFTMSLRTTMRF